ncbi:MAG: hypothetical protein LBD51_01690 [Bifidobacteriaceae bacterium]|jgi:hypothetical protein|nr:hypothetical protein [Bifidobacteriaceae bacterium]
MLDPRVELSGIDLGQWRAAQQLLLRSAQAAPRIAVVHQAGRVLQVRHSAGLEVAGRWPRADRPAQLARAVFEANCEVADWVQVMERDAVSAYHGRVQDSWRPDEDVDVFVARAHRELDRCGDGIAVYPGRPSQVLGLQWRLNASHERVAAALAQVARRGETVLLGATWKGRLWASLVLDVGAAGQVAGIATADAREVDLAGSPAEVLGRLVAWQRRLGKPVAFGLALERVWAEAVLAAPAALKPARIREAVGEAAGAVWP